MMITSRYPIKKKNKKKQKKRPMRSGTESMPRCISLKKVTSTNLAENLENPHYTVYCIAPKQPYIAVPTSGGTHPSNKLQQ